MPGPYIITHGRGHGAMAPYGDVRLNPSSPVAQGLRFLHLDNRNGDMLSGPHWNASLRTSYVFTNSVAMSGNRSDWISPHGTVGNYRQGFYGASTSGPEIAVTQNQWTMAGWAIYPTTDAGLRRGLYGSGGASKHVFSTHYTTNQGILLYTGTTFSHQSATTLPHDRAFHWLVRFDVNGATNDDKIQVFIDGQSISLSHGGAPTTATQAFHIGRGQQPIDQYNWNGGYWNVGGWDRWLSDAEIRYLINPVSRYDLYLGARQRTWFLSGAAGGATITVTTQATLGYTFEVPTVAGGASVAVPDASLGYALQAPTVAGGAAVSISTAASLGYTLEVPAVLTGVSVPVPDASLGYQFHAPIITAAFGAEITVSTAASLGYTLEAPVVVGGARAQVTTAASLGYQFFPPTVTNTNQLITVETAATLGYTCQVPVVAGGVHVQVTTSAMLDYQCQVPAIVGGALVTVPDASLGYLCRVPTIQTDANVTVNVPDLMLDYQFYAPVVSAANVTPELTMWWSPKLGCNLATDETLTTRPVNGEPGFTFDFVGNNSGATYYDSNGDEQTVSVDDTPRFTHVPVTGVTRGLIIDNADYTEAVDKDFSVLPFLRNATDCPSWYTPARGTFFVELEFDSRLVDEVSFQHSLLVFTELTSINPPLSGPRNTFMHIYLTSGSNGALFNASIRDSGSNWPNILSTPVSPLGNEGIYRIGWTWEDNGPSDSSQQFWVGAPARDLGSGVGEGILSGAEDPAKYATAGSVFPTHFACPSNGVEQNAPEHMYVREVRYYNEYGPNIDADFMLDITSGRLSECTIGVALTIDVPPMSLDYTTQAPTIVNGVVVHVTTAATLNYQGSMVSVSAGAATIMATLSGTVLTATEDQAIEGGLTIILTLINGIWESDTMTFNIARAEIIQGLEGLTNQPMGWNEVVRPAIPVSAVVRTSDTVVTITLPAMPAYAIDASETVRSTIPALAISNYTMTVSASPTFTILAVNPPGWNPEPPSACEPTWTGEADPCKVEVT